MPQTNSKFKPIYYSYCEDNLEPTKNDDKYVLFSLKINFMIIAENINEINNDINWFFNPSNILNIVIPTLNNKIFLTLYKKYNDTNYYIVLISIIAF